MEIESGISCSGSNNKGNGNGKQRVIDNPSGGIDYISNLPEAILLCILSFLPLKEWIKVSLLSKRWKYLWTKISNLKLDEVEMITNIIKKDISCPLCGKFPSQVSSCLCLDNATCAGRRKFADFVDRMLLLHSGYTINNLRLSFLYDPQDGYTKRIDTWVCYALRSNIKELELNFSDREYLKFLDKKGLAVRWADPHQPYELPHGFFKPKMLETFVLTFCKFRASSFNTFSSLLRLHLKRLEVLDGSIEHITSRCPVLEDLILEYCLIPDGYFVSKVDIMIKRLSIVHCASKDMLRLDISTPNLLMLTIVEKYLKSASIRKATELIDARISIYAISAHNADGHALNSLLNGYTYGVNIAAETAYSTPKTDALKAIYRYEFPSRTMYNIDEENWESQIRQFPCLKTSLKEITVTELMGRRNEVQLIMFFLKYAAVLEKVTFSLCGPNKYLSYSPDKVTSFRENLSQMFDFIRGSIQAEIKIDGESYPNVV
ncbi:F-box/FBD/LRR-repeat protein At5g56420 [Manihot esculenta]|uniref:F-box/FBD/LRR-repeat protein At5g56420 n=1 Tax=Manihot esculenta TaxID=3983 RepID=UPI001CC6AFA8|nr:F-box/FBD/LRR-repeat protein At5g56420 [Manihot esculenta]